MAQEVAHGDFSSIPGGITSLAVDAVCIELLSVFNSHEQGKIQGMFLILAWLLQREIALSRCIQDIYSALFLDQPYKEQGMFNRVSGN